MTIDLRAHNICTVGVNNRDCNQHNIIRQRPYKYNLQVKITSCQSQRAKELGQYRHVKSSIKKFVLERDNYTCQLCGVSCNWIDHIIPWRISRDNSPENLRAICSSCNTIRRLERRDARPKTYEEWEKWVRKELESFQ